MNRPETLSCAELALDAYARRIVARLDGAADALSHDVTERLRAARMQALGLRRRPAAQLAPQPASSLALLYAGGGTAGLGAAGSPHGWWRSLAPALPLAALLVGVLLFNLGHDLAPDSPLPDVDTALLADELPPAAYADPGFVQYLRSAAPAR